MENLYRKLNNSDGKTILMALFLLLVAVAVSVVIITAAVTAAHQINDNRQAQQAYLTASSAAQLFRDEMAEKSYTHTETVTIGKDWRGRVLYGPVSSYGESVTESSFKALLRDAATGIKDGSLPNATGAYRETTAGISGFDNVDITIHIYDTDSGTATESSTTYSYYDMNITFEVKGDKDKQGYKMKTDIPVQKEVLVSDTTYQGRLNGRTCYYTATETKTTVTFGKGIIAREGLDNINEVTTNE